MLSDFVVAMPQIRSGKIIALAATDRTSLLPDTPTLADLGFRDMSIVHTSFMVTAPAGTPRRRPAAPRRRSYRGADTPDLTLANRKGKNSLRITMAKSKLKLRTGKWLAEKTPICQAIWTVTIMAGMLFAMNMEMELRAKLGVLGSSEGGKRAWSA